MSAAGRGEERRGADFYPTPDACVNACVQTLQIRPGQRVLDPSVGNAPWPVEIHRVHGATSDAVDLYPERYPGLALAVERQIVVRVTRRRFQRYDRPNYYDWIVTNPPYNLAEAFLRQALFCLRFGGRVAFLLRSGFPATLERSALMRAHPPRFTYLLQTRPSYTDDGKTDASEYALFVWEKGWIGRGGIDYLHWSDPVQRELDVARIRALDWTP